MIYLSKSPIKTKEIARTLIKNLKNINRKRATVIALEGELGAGKTVFVKGLAQAFGIKSKIKSPTFTLMKKYKIAASDKQQATSLYHLDCYRLKDHRDLKILGIKEILNNPENIILIEWSDRVKKILPQNHIKIHIDHINSNTRGIAISY